MILPLPTELNALGEDDENEKVMFTFRATDVAGNSFNTNGEKLFFASKKWNKFSSKQVEKDWGIVDF